MKLKAKIAALMVGIMAFGGAASAFAAASPGTAAGAAPDNSARSGLVQKVKAHPRALLNLKKEYQQELDAINAGRVTRLNWKAQLIEKEGKLSDLLIAVKDSGNTEDIAAVKALKADIKTVNQANKNLVEELRGDLKAFREANKSRDTAAAHNELSQAADLLTQINGNLEKKAGLLDQAIALLQ